MSVDPKSIITVEDLEYTKQTTDAGIAPVETSSTASKAYKVGERFWFKGKLCICTVDIASGGTITLNTNCTLDVLGDDVASLKADLNLQSEKINEVKNAFEQDVVHLTTSILDPLVDNFPVKGKYIKNNKGQYGDSANWNTTDYIPIEPATVYYLYNTPNSGYFVALYDSTKAIKTYLSAYTGNVIGVAYNTVWSYMRVSMDVDYIPNFDIRKGSISLYHYGEESFKNTGITVEVGTGKQFTTIRSAWEEVRYFENSTVIVYPGTYDLAQDFATEIASGNNNGILLQNGIKFIFLAGSYVTCNLDNTVASHEEFQPFYTPYGTSGSNAVYKNSNFTLDGLNMTASNCRYCVHDEMANDARPYVHNYINCQMQYSNSFTTPKYNQCIGGGLGVNGYINIDGGFYNSPTSVSIGAGGQIPISYHNSSSASADNKIFIKNIYLAGAGHLRFGYYGTSQTITPIYVSGCSFGAGIEKRAEDETALIDNFSITEWNNTIRT